MSAALRGNSGAKAELTVDTTFIAFYSSAAAATKHAPSVRQAATRFHGSVRRRGSVSVVITSPSRASSRVMNCVGS